jgi:hypothetical protein
MAADLRQAIILSHPTPSYRSLIPLDARRFTYVQLSG